MEIIPPKNQPAPGPAYQRPVPGQPAAPQPNLPQFSPVTAGPPPEERRRSFSGVISTVALFVSAFLIAILLNTFVIQSYQVDGQSMEPTLQNDDRLIVNKIPRTIARIDGRQYVPHRGDVIIFNQASLPGFIGSKQLIKRVIGLPGEHVVVKDGKVTVYNSQHPNGFDPDVNGGYKTASRTTVGEYDGTLANDELFVCGDNRPNSEDSRYFGPIKTDQVVAKLVLRILPLNNAQSF